MTTYCAHEQYLKYRKGKFLLNSVWPKKKGKYSIFTFGKRKNCLKIFVSELIFSFDSVVHCFFTRYFKIISPQLLQLIR